jgi:anti-sigma B factor antagonist
MLHPVFDSEGSAHSRRLDAWAVVRGGDVTGSQLLKLATHWWPDGRVVVEVEGDFDASDGYRVFAEVAQLDLHPGQALELDLKDVTFLDSVGASVLVASEELAGSRGCTFRISAPSLQCRAVLELVGLSRLLPAPDEPVDALPGLLPMT